MVGVSPIGQSTALRSDLKARLRDRLDEKRRRRALHAADYSTYAASGALTIRPKDPEAGLQQFVRNSVQVEFSQLLDNQLAETGKVRAVVVKARQMGISTETAGRFYHRVRHNAGIRANITTHRDDATLNLLSMVRRFVEHDPEAPEMRFNSGQQVVFANDSGFQISTAGAVDTGAGRSFTYQLAHLSELAFWKNAGEHLTAILEAVPDAPGTEIVMESTAYGASGSFYNMAMAARRRESPYQLIFLPWFKADEYRTPPPRGWTPSDALEDLARHKLDPDQLYWAELKNIERASIDGDPTDDLCWRFRREYPSDVDEAFRAGRTGGYFAPSVVAAARDRKNPHQGAEPLIFGCDFACGGGGLPSEQISAAQLTGTAQDLHGVEDGDRNCFVSHRGRVKGAELYDTFRDRDTVSVADKLAARIVELGPDKVFMDRGGGGGGVYDVLVKRGFGRVMELVDFGGESPDPQYRNLRAYMHGAFRDWLRDGDIPDDPELESEITAIWVLREDGGVLLAPKRDVRKKLKVSPDRLDACVLCHAAPVMKGAGRSIRVGGASR